MLKMVSMTVVGVVALGILTSTSSAQCVQNVQPAGRRNLLYRPSWEMLPRWGDSQFYDLLSVFDDPWFSEIRENSHRALEDRMNRLYQPQQNVHDYNSQNHMSGEDQCRRQRNMASDQEEFALEETQHLQKLAILDREEKDLLNQQNKHMEMFRQQQEEFRRKREEINEQRGEVRHASSEGSSEGKFQITREQQLQEMRERQQRMAEEQQRHHEKIEATKVSEQRQKSRLEQQRRQAEFHEQQRQTELHEERRQVELQERRQTELQERRQAELQEQQRRDALREEERLKSTWRDRSGHDTRQLNVRDIVKHQVTGYDPDDITIKVTNGQIKVDGKHICHCNENCIAREFVRLYPLPPGIGANSVVATMDIHGNIRIQGEQNGQQHVDTSSENTLKVRGLGIPQSTRPSVDELRRCLGEKGGIKLNQINKNTGRVHVDEEFKYEHEVERVANEGDTDSYDHEDGSIEVVDY